MGFEVCNRWWLRKFFTSEKTYVLNYLTLSISDKEVTKQFQLTNSCLMHSIYWISMTSFVLLLLQAIFNYLYRDGLFAFVLLHLGGLSFSGLWQLLWHKSKLNMPKCILWYLLVYGGLPALIYWDILGPFNVPGDQKSLFDEHLVVNYVICSVLCVNSFQFSGLMALTFLALSFATFEGQC